MARLENDRAQPGQLGSEVRLHGRQQRPGTWRRIGVIVQDDRAGVKIDDQIGATLGEAVEQAEGRLVSRVKHIGASGDRC